MPTWIEIERSDDTYSAEIQIQELIAAKKRPSIVLVMLG
jgi:hypothetical protein